MSENPNQAPTTLIIVALLSSVLYMIVAVSDMLQYRSGTPVIIGTIIGCLLWPMVIVGIVSIWKKNRNSKTAVKTFMFATLFFFGTHLASLYLLPKYAEHIRLRQPAEVAPAQ